MANPFFFVPLVVLTFASSALGQQIVGVGGEPVPDQRGYVAASAGVEFEPPTRPVFSIEYGENLHRDVQAYATFSYFENLMKRSLQDDLSATAAAISAVTGTRLEFQGRDRGLVFAAGAKYLIGSGGVRPYVGGGAGVLNIRRRIVEPRLGDVTGAVLNEYGLGEVDFTAISVTRPMVEAALGVGIVAGPTYLDFGYRYRRAFHMTESFDLSQFSAGVGYKF